MTMLIGIIASGIVAGLVWGFTGNAVLGVALAVVVISGLFGRSKLESTGGLIFPLAIGYMAITGTWGKWWIWLLGWLVALFIGNLLSSFRDLKREGN